ncbi:MAG TPA: VWA domain-containing protein [Thermoanaerobaculia bacterium]|nr:VWA domain-containing protein [Thermoanaerobaculia bacterium]
MSFRSPIWLWAAAAVPVALVFLMSREALRARIARRFSAERLRGVANPLRAARPIAMSIAIAAAALALAGPYAGYTTVPIVSRESNRVIAIDVSHSMAAEDVGASRLAAAKALARVLLENHGGRVALVTFEAAAEVVSPLTNDSDAVLALLDTLQPGEVGVAGSDLGAAIEKSLQLVQIDSGQKADVILISDGEEQGRGRIADALRFARARGVSVSAIVVGTAGGGTIPAGNGVLRDESGEIVTTRARSENMQRIARDTGGTLLQNPFSESALDPLMQRGAGGASREKDVRVPVDRYQWPLALAFMAFFCGSLLNRGAE